MAEVVNQRIEDMLNELEQMQRTGLYTPEEIREIYRRRKEFEYRIQRKIKDKEDFVHYIAYDMALLEDISVRRKELKLKEKKDDIEYSIAKRMNKIFKHFLARFQNEIEVYFQYIKFCKCVGFDEAVSQTIGQMLQIHGDKPKMWQLASNWESEEKKSMDTARDFLVKGIHRHPHSEILYLDLFNLELLVAISGDDEFREKQVKRATIIWKNGVKSIKDLKFLFRLCDTSEKFNFAQTITADIRKEIWALSDNEKDVWTYIATKELRGQHWEEIDEIISADDTLPSKVKRYVLLYEAALQKFSDEAVCTRYIHELLKLDERSCTAAKLVSLVKRALSFGHDWRVLSDDLYSLWIEILKVEGKKSEEDLLEILKAACVNNPHSRILWQERIILSKDNVERMEEEIARANNKLKQEDMVTLWNAVIDTITSKAMINKLYEKIRNCDSKVLLSVKPKLLRKVYYSSGIKAARALYDDFLRTPPLQIEVHNIMIELEKYEDVINPKCLRKCYEAATHIFGMEDVNIWLQYMDFEKTNGNAKFVPTLHQRAIATLQPKLVEQFIELNALGKVKTERKVDLVLKRECVIKH